MEGERERARFTSTRARALARAACWRTWSMSCCFASMVRMVWKECDVDCIVVERSKYVTVSARMMDWLLTSVC